MGKHNIISEQGLNSNVFNNKVSINAISFTFLQLLWAGVHLGHDSVYNTILSSWAMLGMSNNIWVINLWFTILWFRKVFTLIHEVIFNSGAFLFVNHKIEMSSCIWESAFLCGQSFSVGNWVGGSLTNFKYIYNTVLKLPGTFNGNAEFIAKYSRDVGSSNFWAFGLVGLSSLPNVVFVSSMRESKLALFEALSLRLPVVSVLDSNCNSQSILYPIPGNDDSVGSVTMYNKVVAKSILINQLAFMRNFSENLKVNVNGNMLVDLVTAIDYSTQNFNGYMFGENNSNGSSFLFYISVYFWDIFTVASQLIISWCSFTDYSWRKRYVGNFDWLDILGDVSSNNMTLDSDLRLSLKYDNGVFEVQTNILKSEVKLNEGD